MERFPNPLNTGKEPIENFRNGRPTYYSRGNLKVIGQTITTKADLFNFFS